MVAEKSLQRGEEFVFPETVVKCYSFHMQPNWSLDNKVTPLRADNCHFTLYLCKIRVGLFQLQFVTTLHTLLVECGFLAISAGVKLRAEEPPILNGYLISKQPMLQSSRVESTMTP